MLKENKYLWHLLKRIQRTFISVDMGTTAIESLGRWDSLGSILTPTRTSGDLQLRRRFGGGSQDEYLLRENVRGKGDSC